MKLDNADSAPLPHMDKMLVAIAVGICGRCDTRSCAHRAHPDEAVAEASVDRMGLYAGAFGHGVGTVGHICFMMATFIDHSGTWSTSVICSANSAQRAPVRLVARARALISTPAVLCSGTPGACRYDCSR
jgi:hypothetical protein